MEATWWGKGSEARLNAPGAVLLRKAEVLLPFTVQWASRLLTPTQERLRRIWRRLSRCPVDGRAF
jgi:hypothetical protein